MLDVCPAAVADSFYGAGAVCHVFFAAPIAEVVSALFTWFGEVADFVLSKASRCGHVGSEVVHFGLPMIVGKVEQTFEKQLVKSCVFLDGKAV